MGLLDAGDTATGAVQYRRVIQRMCGQQVFQIGGLCRVKMRALVVYEQPQWRGAGTARKQRAQERILDAQHRRVAFGGHGQAAMRGGGIPPDAHQIIGPRHAKGHTVSRKAQNAPYAGLGQKTAIVNVKPPGLFRSDGGIERMGHAACP